MKVDLVSQSLNFFSLPRLFRGLFTRCCKVWNKRRIFDLRLKNQIFAYTFISYVKTATVKATDGKSDNGENYLNGNGENDKR